MEFLQTKPQVENMKIKYYGLLYAVTKNRDEKENVVTKHENDYFNFNDIITTNHYIGIINENVILR